MDWKGTALVYYSGFGKHDLIIPPTMSQNQVGDGTIIFFYSKIIILICFIFCIISTISKKIRWIILEKKNVFNI